MKKVKANDSEAIKTSNKAKNKLNKTQVTSEISDETTESELNLKKRKSENSSKSHVKKRKTEPEAKKSYSKTSGKPNWVNKKNTTVSKGKNVNPQSKVEDWSKYKKEVKELRKKRKVGKFSGSIADIQQVKKLSEIVRRKVLKGGEKERENIVQQLHQLLSGNYKKHVLNHEITRIIQYILKFGSESIRKEVFDELHTLAHEMIESKYAKFCLKRLFKHSTPAMRSILFKQLYGKAVQLTSHVTSASVFEFAYSTYATPTEKQYFIQEFFGDIYNTAKDDSVKHLKDVYEKDSAMKTAALNATKDNLMKVINKQLLDSSLVHTVLWQYLGECREDDKKEMVGLLVEHLAVLSNTKDGARVAMKCIWLATSKERKTALKAIKEHVVDLSKHEHGHCTVITLLDSIDDTVLLNKIVVKPILDQAKALAADEWGRKVLLWLVAPGDTLYFHPTFVNELKSGLENSSSKKPVESRREEILGYVTVNLLKSITEDVKYWMANASIGMVTLAVLKSGKGEFLGKVLEVVAELIVDPNWTIKEGEKEILAVEHPGMHMVLKKLAQNDSKLREKDESTTLGGFLVGLLTNDLIDSWLKTNRTCFLLVNIIESGSKSTRKQLRHLLKKHLGEKQACKGAELLFQKLEK